MSGFQTRQNNLFRSLKAWEIHFQKLTLSELEFVLNGLAVMSTKHTTAVKTELLRWKKSQVLAGDPRRDPFRFSKTEQTSKASAKKRLFVFSLSSYE